MKQLTHCQDIRRAIEREFERTGGIFRLKPTWVARGGITQPGRRLKLQEMDVNQNLFVCERWLSSVTYADNGSYNAICPPDHGYSYIVTPDGLVRLLDAFRECPELLLGSKEKEWDVLPKFFDNRHRIPFHLHPCDHHVKKGLRGKPESYHFPIELNLNPNLYPVTPVGVDPLFSDEEILERLMAYQKGDNALTDLGVAINLIPGTGWYMPPCTLHAPGSLVTYELQVASDVSCIPESRVNDMPMPQDMVDRVLPVSVEEDGFLAVCEYILDMIKCPESGNRDNFRKEYFRPPVNVANNDCYTQDYVIYRLGRNSETEHPDLYSAKRTQFVPGKSASLAEQAAFGAIALRGSGTISLPGKEPVVLASASFFATREDCFEDEIFVAASAAKQVEVHCTSSEPLAFYQHFSSHSNPESTTL